ncbi:MAG: GNAT family N-acetyltransferase [Acidimicrobiales bacterium]
MDITLRPVAEEEFARFARVVEGSFGFHADDQVVDDLRSVTELDRTIGAFDGDDVLGSAGAFTFELTLPGGTTESVAGVTYVGVLGSHRRRGILRSMMQHQLDDVVARGESLAILTASEGSIYRRFGYGPAASAADWTIATGAATLAWPSTAGGQLRIVEPAEAAAAAPGVYEQRRRSIPGAIDRTDAWWHVFFADREVTRDGASARFYVVHHDDEGTADGFLAYRLRYGYDHGLAGNTLVLDQLWGVDDEVETALWQYCLTHDLVTRVTAAGRPVDEPLRWRLTDPRQLVCTDLTDSVWVRVLDVPRALTARHYRTGGGLVIEVTDPFRPATSGRYRLDVDADDDGARCARTDDAPDLSLDVADLGTVYLGGTPPSALARAGRIVAHRSGALERADALFAASPLPWLTTGF